MTATSAVANVIVDALPSVVLTHPATNLALPAPASVTLTAEADGNYGTVTNVQFYAGSTLLGTGTANGTTYSFTWSNVPAGTNSLTARATDDHGVTATSASVTLIVNALPQVSLTSPTNGTVVLAGTDLGLTATATSQIGLTQVEFLLGTNSLGVATNTGSPYTLAWTNVPVGTNYLTVLATDNLQMTSTSAVVMVIGDPVMTVAITAPTNGTAVAAPASVVLSATASNSLVGIQQVEFFRGTNSLGVVTASPYTLTWNNAAVGTNSITARATDVLGMSKNSDPVTLIVGTRPAIVFHQPVNNTVFLAPANVTNQITAGSGVGVTQVELFQGVGTTVAGATNLLAVLTNAPPYTNTAFSFVWPDVGTNVYSLFVRATDTLGLTGTAAVTNLVVEHPPTVTLTGPASGQVFTPAPATIPLSATASGNFGSIASVQFFNGNALIGPGSTTNGSSFTFTWTPVAAGTNYVTARARDIYGVMSTSAVAQIIVAIPPTVQITAPAVNAVYQAPAEIPINVTASGTVGIVQVEFFHGTNLLQVVTNAAPFSNTAFGMVWTNVGTNVHQITARATDVLGVSGTSAITPVVVDIPPSVTMVSPTNGTVLAAPANVTLTASATGNFGSVTNVDFYSGSAFLGQGVFTNGAYTRTLLLQGGEYHLTAVAFDSWGLGATSAPVTLVMDAPTVVSVTEPPAGSVFLSPAAFTVSASATNSNTNGTIQQVSFYDGTNLLATVTNPPYSLIYSNAPLGYRSLTARALDGLGLEWSSPTVQVIVDTPPSVALTNPVPPTTITTLDMLTLGATAASSAVSIARVEFYQGTNYLGTAAGSPYAVAWRSGSVGSFDFTAVAVDSVGVKATSAVVTVSVILPTAPVPVVSPASGLYSNAVSVTITGGPLGAGYRYSVDGGVTWLDYVNGVSLQSLITNTVILAKTICPGYYDSAVTVVVYTFPDSDGDGLTDAHEHLIGTDPLQPDTDNDGRSDQQELVDGTNPLDPASVTLVRLAAWPFVGTNWLAGERGQLPLVASNAAYTPGFSAGAVRINSTNAARLAYRDVEADGTANLNVRNGTIRFWFRPDWDMYYSQPAQPGRLIELGTRGGENPEGWWALHFDEQGLLHFTTQSAGGEEREHFPWGVWMPTWSSYSYGGWMQFTLTYSPTNILLYGNGSLLAEGDSGVDGYPDFAVRHAHGFSLGSDRFGGQQAQGSFELVETYNHPLDADAVYTRFTQEAVHLAKLDSDYDGIPDQAEMYWYGTDPADAASTYPVRLAYWQFSDTNWVVNHDWGWNYWYGTEFAPLVATNLESVLSWDGSALSVAGGAVATRLAYRDAEEDGNPNINLRNGTVRFWFRPNWASASAGGAGPGVEASLVEVGADDASTDFGVWRVFVSADGNTLGFLSRSNSLTTNTTSFSVPVSWQSGVWHQVVLSYGPTNQDLFVDAQLLATQTNAMCYPDLGVRRAYGIHLGGDHLGGRLAGGWFDNLETFNYPMDTNQVAQDYAAQLQAASLVDSDYDGLSDAAELQNGSDPLNPDSVPPLRLGYWSFNDEWQWVGDRGQWPWMPYAQAIPTMRTNGVRINATMYGYGVLGYYETEADGIANINCRKGTVSFWFKPDWDTASAANPEGGPGHEGQLFSLGSRDTNLLACWWGVSLNAQGNLLTFSAQTNGEAATFLSAPIQWQSNRWYHLALAYSPTGSALYVNGQIATNGAGVSLYPDAATRQSYGLLMGDAAEGGQSADGVFDELETYNYPLSAAAVGQAYTNALASMALVDSDYDGRNDAQELADGTDSVNPDSVLPVKLATWHFDAGYTGAQGQSPLFQTNTSLATSWNTKALLITGTNIAQLAYRCEETNGRANLNLRSGSICFWFKPNWASTTSGGTGPGCEARLIEVGRRIPESTNEWWSLYTDTNGTQLTFEAQGSGQSPAVYFTRPIGWQSNQWHLVCLTYTPTNSQLYLDGVAAVTEGYGISAWPEIGVRAATGFRVGSDWEGANWAGGQFDELETYNYPLTEAEVSASLLTNSPYDSDGDGLSNYQEALFGTNPSLIDSDGDGLDDGVEYLMSSSWSSPSSSVTPAVYPEPQYIILFTPLEDPWGVGSGRGRPNRAPGVDR
ncbi:MAG: PKD domain-containing protein [Limisphaerales bacterium]|nr:MAG: PKD domain-containing protein [Limisphaerales bacterium]